MGRDFFFFFFILLFLPNAFAREWQAAFEQAKKQKLHESREWLNLGHYKKSLFGGYESESLDSPFFIAETGRHSPEEELRETIKSLLKKDNQRLACAFPARLLFLQAKLPSFFSKTSSPECPDFQKFKDRLQAKSLSLVFSSYYLNAPASAFGHTLLRFVKNPDVPSSQRYELLDYAANYAAVVTTNNSFLYGLMGLVGGFRGEFATMPYFYKIREYNDFESRDLWDYELSLSPKELQKLIAHLWEMKQVHFPYYYLTHNCSYHMLSLLDAVNPDWELTEKLRKVVLPADTIKVVANTPGLLKNISFRPSKQRVLKKRLEKNSSEQNKLIKEAIKENKPELLITPDDPLKSVQLLDTALEAFDFIHAKKVIKEDPKIMKQKRKFLIQRSELPYKSSEVEIEPPTRERPDLTHGSRRLTVMQGENKEAGSYTELELRLSLHDLLDPQWGQSSGSTMEMGKLKVRYQDEFSIENFTFARAQSLTAITSFFNNLSWEFYAGAKSLKDKKAYSKLSPQMRASGGYSLGNDSFYFTAFLHAGVEQQRKISKSSFRLLAGPKVQALALLPFGLRVLSYAQIDYFALMQEDENHAYWGLKLRKNLGKNLTINVDAHDYETGQEAALGLSYFY